MVDFSVRVTDPQSRRLEQLSEKKGVPVSEIIRQAIDEHIGKEERESLASGNPKTIRTGQGSR